MGEFYQKPISEIEDQLNTNIDHGLSESEVLKRLELYGPNQLIQDKKRSIFMKFFDQLKDFMILVLMAAALISIIINKDIYEGLLIVMIVLINAFLGVFQEQKAEKSLEAIKKLSSPHVTVLRDKIEKVVNIEDLVVGDVVILKAGDFVPADVRIIDSINLKIDESALTGESVSVDKISNIIEEDDIPLGDRLNLGYMSTVITYGRGKALVLKTGMDTEIGKIAQMLKDAKDEETPLQKTISKLGKTLALIALAVTTLIFVIEIIEGLLAGTPDFAGALLFSVSLAVAAIPEGLPAIITVVLSLGMQNLAKHKAIMKTLPAAETLGSTTVICSDKTGTLTQNVMTVLKYYSDDKINEVNNYKKTSSSQKLINFSVLSNDTVVRLVNDDFEKIGEPTEIALIDFAINTKNNPVDIISKYERVYEIPFDSERKLMTTVHKIDNKYYSITKGAPDVLLDKVANVEIDGKILPITKNDFKNYEDANNKMADDALRILAFAYKEINDISNIENELLEENLTIIGLVGMIDPERPEVKDAIYLCSRAGIKTIMITGDHKNTATAIAKNLNILSDDKDLVITGFELDQMSDEELLEKIEHIKVYSRVSPENKVRIVKTFRSLGHIVAMTGDGVNDAPSIKEADIGIAMGITGTEVAKGASDMVLTDDNFATIVNAVSEGRNIFSNIKKTIHYLLSANIGEIIVMFLGVTIGSFLFKDELGMTSTVHILIAAQILWVNVVTDSLMAIALGLDHREPNIMEQKPRDPKKSFFADGLGKVIVWHGLMVGLLTFAAYYIGYQLGVGQANKVILAQTMAFMTLSISELFHAFNVRSLKYSTFKLKRNNYLIGAFFISLFLQITILFFPFTRKLFHITTPNFIEWLIIIGLSITPLIIVETIKLIKNKSNKK